MLEFFNLSNTKNFCVVNRYFLCLITFLIVGSSFPTIALEEKTNTNYELATLQTQITQDDLKIIEQLVTIAECQSPQVLEAKAAMGWGTFQDIVSLELSPSLTTTNYNSPDESEERSATEMLNTNAQAQIALQELAVCVGISAQTIVPILNGR